MFFPIGIGELGRIEVGPGLVTLIGGAPGAGKTAFTMQAVVDALRSTASLRAVVCNVETTPSVLLDRQLARLSGVDLTTIRYRRLRPEHADRIDQAMAVLEPVCERLTFVRPPFDLTNVVETADAFDAGLIVLDYIQRIPPPGEHGDRRGSVDATMSHVRNLADAGAAIIVVAAVSRGKDALVVLILFDLLRANGGWIEIQTVIFDRDTANVAKDFGQSCERRITFSQEVEVAGGAVRQIGPQTEQHGPLEPELILVLRLAKAVKQSLDDVASEDELKILPLLAGQIHQPMPD